MGRVPTPQPEPSLAGAVEAASSAVLDVDHEIVVRLLPDAFQWIEVEAECLGPLEPRIFVDDLGDNERQAI